MSIKRLGKKKDKNKMSTRLIWVAVSRGKKWVAISLGKKESGLFVKSLHIELYLQSPRFLKYTCVWV